MNFWYDIAKYSQAFTLVVNYQQSGDQEYVRSGVYSLVPEEGYYPPNIAPHKEIAYQALFTTHANNTLWINQQQMVVGRRYDLAMPLTLDMKGECFQEWQTNSTARGVCKGQ
jgi:hypothetical protein